MAISCPVKQHELLVPESQSSKRIHLSYAEFAQTDLEGLSKTDHPSMAQIALVARDLAEAISGRH
jgi:hypothetical protein